MNVATCDALSMFVAYPLFTATKMPMMIQISNRMGIRTRPRHDEPPLKQVSQPDLAGRLPSGRL